MADGKAWRETGRAGMDVPLLLHRSGFPIRRCLSILRSIAEMLPHDWHRMEVREREPRAHLGSELGIRPVRGGDLFE
jgi:hypothetical protein